MLPKIFTEKNNFPFKMYANLNDIGDTFVTN